MPEYNPCKYDKKSLLIDNYLVLGEIYCEESEYKLYDLSVNWTAAERIDEISKSGYGGFELFSDKNSHYMNVLGSNFSLRNKKIFLYSEVLAEKPV